MNLYLSRSKLVLMFSSASRKILASFMCFVHYTRTSQEGKIVYLGLPVFLGQFPELK